MQALCELYNRPAEIWAYDSLKGARKLRTFHETAGSSRGVLPLRLSYYGGGHYDSITDEKHNETILRLAPGVIERQALQRVVARLALAQSGNIKS